MTRRRRHPRLPLVGAALALVLGGAACGFGADPPIPTVPSSGPAAAEGPTPAQARVGDSVAAAELAAWTSGALRRAGTVRFTVLSGGRTLTGEVDVRGATPAYRISGGSGQDAVEVRWVDGVGYLGGPQFRAAAGGRAFLRVRPGGADQPSRLLAPLLATLQRAADPSALVAGLGQVRARAVTVQQGRTTWSMSVTAVQLRAATERLLGERLPAQAAERLSAVTLEQTLDTAGRLVTARQVGGADGDATVTYTGYGSEVRVAAPAAADVGTANG